MKRKIMCGIVVAGLFVAGLIFSLSFRTNDNSVSVSFSELSLGEDKLIEKADAIVLGKLIEKKNVKTETIYAKKSGEANIVCTYSIYDFKAYDIIAGKVLQNIDIIFTGSNKPQEIEFNKDYVFFLEKDMLGGNNYHLLSCSEGVFEVEKNNNNTENKNIFFNNKNSGVKFDRDSLINKVKELKK